MLKPEAEAQRRRITVEQAEADYFKELAEIINDQTDAKRLKELRKPMGFQNEKWEVIKSQMIPGDELWEYCSSIHDFDQFRGASGIELIRNGTVVAQMRMSVS
jgi:hypothetical protein